MMADIGMEDIIKARMESRQRQKDAMQISDQGGVGKKIGGMLLGVGAGFSDALTGKDATGRVIDLLNRAENARLKALESDDSAVDDLMDMWKIQQQGDLQRELLKMRQAGDVYKEDKADYRLEKRLDSSESIADKRIQAQITKEQLAQKRAANKEIRQSIDKSIQDLKKFDFKFAPEEQTQNIKRKSLEQMMGLRKAANEAGTFTGAGPLAGRLGQISSQFGTATPEFTNFSVKLTDILNKYIKETTGAAVTASEMPRLKAVLPRIEQDEASFEASIQAALDQADAIIQERKISQLRLARNAIAASIPDDEIRQNALQAVEAGADPFEVLSRAKKIYMEQVK